MGAKAGFITIIGNFIIGAVLFLFDPDFLIAGGETLFFLTVFVTLLCVLPPHWSLGM